MSPATRDRKLQRALLQFFKPDNYFEVRKALEQAGRTDLIGGGCDALIPAHPPKEDAYGAATTGQRRGQRRLLSHVDESGEGRTGRRTGSAEPGISARSEVAEAEAGEEREPVRWSRAVEGSRFLRVAAMALSVFDLFKIGIGPSSSHTVGPMWAALRFVRLLEARGVLGQVRRVRADLYGSLALTGRGHATDKAILLGLSGEQPDTVDPDAVAPLLGEVRSQHTLRLAGASPSRSMRPTTSSSTTMSPSRTTRTGCG